MILQTTADSRSACRESGKKNEATDPSHPQSLNDLKDFNDLWDLNDLKDLRGLRDFKDFRDLREGANAEWGLEGRKIERRGGGGRKKIQREGNMLMEGEIC